MQNNGPTDRDVLLELLAAQKKEVRHARITSIASLVLAVVLLVGAVVAVPRVLSTVEEARQTMDQARDAMTQVETFLEQTDSLTGDIETLVRSANRVIVDNTDAVTEAVSKLNGVDFETLNKAIQDLADAVAPLAQLGRMFS